jgi:CRP-like cAMP-binding protein
MTRPLIAKLERRDRLSESERTLLLEAAAVIRTFEPQQELVRQGSEPDYSTLVLEGWTCRVTAFADGRRQITAFHIPGDFVDLHAFLLKPMDHAVAALSRVRAALIPHTTLKTITEEEPHLTRMLWLSTLIDAAIHRQWLAGAGQLDATGQLAHLLCELCLRLETVDLAPGRSFTFPVTQSTLAEALGLSAVHVNRTVQELRRTGLVTWKGSRVTLRDWDGLVKRAGFDPTYLNLIPAPR